METFHADVLCGAETGLLKGINIQNSCWKNIGPLTECSKEKEICVMCWGNSEQSTFCVATKNRKLELFSREVEKGWVKNHEWDIGGGSGKIKAVVPYQEKYITADESGVIKLWNTEGEDTFEINSQPNLCCLAQNSKSVNHIAVGGKENELKVYDISSASTVPLFQAKNVRHDWLNLRVPVWILGIKFLPQSDSLVTCTGHHSVRVYDPKVQRRPVINLDFDEYPITAMDIVYSSDRQVVVGNTQGKMALFDLRKKQMVQCYKGFAGGIRNIQCHTKFPYAVSCGLDRFVRIHDVNSKELLHKYYLKSRLNCLLLSNDLSIDSDESKNGTNEEDSLKDKDENAEADDEVWKNMSVVHTKTVKRKLDTEEISLRNDDKKSARKKKKKKIKQ